MNPDTRAIIEEQVARFYREAKGYETSLEHAKANLDEVQRYHDNCVQKAESIRASARLLQALLDEEKES